MQEQRTVNEVTQLLSQWAKAEGVGDERFEVAPSRMTHPPSGIMMGLAAMDYSMTHTDFVNHRIRPFLREVKAWRKAEAKVAVRPGEKDLMGGMNVSGEDIPVYYNTPPRSYIPSPTETPPKPNNPYDHQSIGSVNNLLAERGTTHGNYDELAPVIQGIKHILHTAPNWDKLTAPQKESLDLTATKIGRIVCGDPNCIEHWDDIGGYVKLVQRILANGKS